MGNPWRSRSNDRETRRRSTRPGGRALSGADAVRTPGLVRQDRGLAPSLNESRRRLTRGVRRCSRYCVTGLGCGMSNGRADRTEWNGMIAVEISAGYVNRPCVLVPDSSPATNLYQLIRRTPPECLLRFNNRGDLHSWFPPQKRHMFSKLNTCRRGINYKNRKNNFFFTDRFACVRAWSGSTLGPRASSAQRFSLKRLRLRARMRKVTDVCHSQCDSFSETSRTCCS